MPFVAAALAEWRGNMPAGQKLREMMMKHGNAISDIANKPTNKSAFLNMLAEMLSGGTMNKGTNESIDRHLGEQKRLMFMKKHVVDPMAEVGSPIDPKLIR